MKTLIVTNPFGGRQTGRRITDPAEIDAVLAGENAAHVVAAEHPDAPAAPEPGPRHAQPGVKPKKSTRQE